MRTKAKHRVDKFKVVAQHKYETRLQRSLFIFPKPYVCMGYVLVLPLEIRTLSTE